jgi:nucleoside phosphorylase
VASPVAVIGICYGLEEDGNPPQRLGDVAVANQVLLIAHKIVVLRRGT